MKWQSAIPHSVVLVLALCGVTLLAQPVGTGTTSVARGAVFAASCSVAHVTTAIAAASTGGTVVIPAGTCDWSGGGITLSKSLTILGAGSGCPSACDNATTLQVGTAIAFSVGNVDGWRISGLTFDGAANASGSVVINAGGADASTDWRVDHCHFKDATGRGISVGAYASTAGYAPDFPGLIDNNRFSASARSKAIQIYGGSLNTYGSWADTLTLGGTSFLFVESNYFVYATMPDGVSTIDADTGARMVIRYNSFTNGDISTHGQEECSDISADPVCQWRSTHGWEMYGNTFAFSTSHSFTLNLRGGTGVIWGNDVSGTAASTTAVRYAYERGDETRTCLDAGACQGSSPFDGNESGKYGYMCWQQIGATGANGITPMPVYQWRNSDAAVVGDLTSVSFEAGCNYQHVQLGRDVLILDNTTDVGTLASRPATCAVGDGYWATDQGTWNADGTDGLLYRCTATDTWALHYTPYTYPHPLRTP